MNFLMKDVAKLENELKDASQAYYTDGSSKLSDAEWDAKAKQLKELKPDSEVLNQVGHGYDIDADTTKGEKHPHLYTEVGSLDKVRTWHEYKLQMGKVSEPVAVSLKLDGISIVLYYDAGKLVKALTRGDGHVGIEVTEKIKTIEPDVCQMDTVFTGAVRGEILMSIENFNIFKQRHPEAKNPRNSTAGLMNKDAVPLEDLRLLNVVVYTVVGDPRHEIEDSMRDMVCFLDRNFKNVAPYRTEVLNEPLFYDDMLALKELWYGKYPADGIVITKMSLRRNDTDGVEYDAVAFKFPSEIKTAKVKHIEWNMSKTRYAVPRVEITPIELAGTTVSYCTGYNAQFIQKEKIGVGAVVKVEKRGEIIPNIVGVVEQSNHDALPKTCPVCGHTLIWEGVHLKCPNSQCGNASEQDLSVWLEVLAPVEGLKDALRFKFIHDIFGDVVSVETFMDAIARCMIYLPACIDAVEDSGVYRLANMLNVILDSKGVTGHSKLIQDMMKQILSTKQDISISRALQALNIPRFGELTSDKFARNPSVAKSILTDFVYTDETGLKLYDDCVSYIGVANAQSLHKHQDKLKRLKYLWERIVWEPETAAETKGKIAITGKLSVKRSDFEKELKAAGYVPGEIAKDTLFLITDDPDSSSSKNKKADAWGITKITESEFRNKYM